MNISALPDCVILKILANLSYRDLLTSYKVCKRFSMIAAIILPKKRSEYIIELLEKLGANINSVDNTFSQFIRVHNENFNLYRRTLTRTGQLFKPLQKQAKTITKMKKIIKDQGTLLAKLKRRLDKYESKNKNDKK